MNRYVKRLYTEWCEFGKIIVAVDFYGTIIVHRESPDYCWRVISLLRKIQEDSYIVINTPTSIPKYVDILDKMASLKIKVTGINENPIPLPVGHHGKIYANIYLDDRAGLLESLEILEEAWLMYKEYKKLRAGSSIID